MDENSDEEKCVETNSVTSSRDENIQAQPYADFSAGPPAPHERHLTSSVKWDDISNWVRSSDDDPQPRPVITKLSGKSTKSNKSRTFTHNYILGAFFELPSLHQEYVAYTTTNVGNLVKARRKSEKARQEMEGRGSQWFTMKSHQKRNSTGKRLRKSRNSGPRPVQSQSPPPHPAVQVQSTSTHSPAPENKPSFSTNQSISRQSTQRGKLKSLRQILGREHVEKHEDDQYSISISRSMQSENHGQAHHPQKGLHNNEPRMSLEEEQTVFILGAIRGKIDDEEEQSIEHKNRCCSGGGRGREKRTCFNCVGISLVVFIVIVSCILITLPIIILAVQFITH